MSGQNYSLYILRCCDGTLYTGIAIDVAKRLREHEDSARGAKYLRGRGPLRLVFEQSLGDRGSASRAEYKVKQLDRRQKEALIAGKVSLEECLDDVTAAGDQASGVAGG